MFDGASNFLKTFLMKIFHNAPQIDIDVEEYTDKVIEVMGMVNYFIPIHTMNMIFTGWATIIFTTAIIWILSKFMTHLLGR